MAVVNIGANIKAIRKKQGMTQDELAELAMLNRVTIAKYEAGTVEPGARALAQIAAALDVSVQDLYNDDVTVVSATEKSPIPGLSSEEQILITNYRALTSEGQAALMAALSGLLSAFRRDE